MTFFAHGWKLLLSNNNLFIHYIIFCSCHTCSCSPFVHQATFHSLHDLLSSPDNLSFTGNGRHTKSRSRSRGCHLLMHAREQTRQCRPSNACPTSPNMHWTRTRTRHLFTLRNPSFLASTKFQLFRGKENKTKNKHGNNKPKREHFDKYRPHEIAGPISVTYLGKWDKGESGCLWERKEWETARELVTSRVTGGIYE